MTFYERYSALCKEIGKTPTGVGAELSIDRATINYWKNNHVPKTKALLKISNYFDVSVDYLLGETDIREITKVQTGNDIAKVALFGGNTEVTDEMWEEVKDYVEYIKQKHIKD